MFDSPTKVQMEVVHQVAAQFWQVPLEEIAAQMNTIEVVKFTGGKVAGFLPHYQTFPSVFFKVYFYDRGYRFEVAGLNAAAEMPRVEGVRTPSVVAIVPEYKALLMKRRTWEDTSSPWKRLWVNKLGIDWFKVGKWLRAFHDTQVTTERNDYFLRKKFEKFEFYLGELHTLFTETQLGKMRAIAENAKEYFQHNTCEWVISHGDFGLDNIKKSGSELEIIDFEDCQPAPREFDLINFYTRFEYANWFPVSRNYFTFIKSQFLEGYGQATECSIIKIFLLLLIKLDMLETYDRRRKNSLTNASQRYLFSVLAGKCVRSIQHYMSSIS